MNIFHLLGVFCVVSPILSKPLEDNLDGTGLQVLPMKTCTDFMEAGHDVKINTPDEGDFSYAMCVIKGPITSNAVVGQGRRSYDHPNVEVGPGEFKSEIINHGPEYLANKLKYLMEIKKKMEDEKKKKQEMLEKLNHA